MKEIKEKKYWFYKIENIENKKAYIGLTSNIARRRARHFTDLKTSNHHNSFLQKEYDIYGKDCFLFSVIHETVCTDEEASKIEMSLIKRDDTYLNGYNQNTGGTGGNRGATNGGSKLIQNDIFIINSALEFSSRPGAVLAEIFDVTTTTISRIKKGESHFANSEIYKSLPEAKRIEIFEEFDKASSYRKIKANQTIIKSKRRLSEFDVHLVLYNESVGRIVPIKRLARYLDVKSSNTLYSIINEQSYKDYRISYLEKTKANINYKDKMASFLREKEEQTSRTAGTSLRATNHNIAEKTI